MSIPHRQPSAGHVYPTSPAVSRTCLSHIASRQPDMSIPHRQPSAGHVYPTSPAVSRTCLSHITSRQPDMSIPHRQPSACLQHINSDLSILRCSMFEQSALSFSSPFSSTNLDCLLYRSRHRFVTRDVLMSSG
ncbi:hypothetical protein ACOMHN_049127 [Nucella lapillus]